MEIRRFGVGNRRPEGPIGSEGVEGQVIHSDARGVIAELAFRKGGRIEPHENPNTTWFIVIEGGGWVVVDGERTRVAAGEAVLWPPDVEHSAWTDYGEMRAFVVEFGGADDAAVRGILSGEARAVGPGKSVGRGEGALAGRDVDPTRLDRSSGEPL